MSLRDSKNLSEWLDLDYARRPRTFRRMSKWICWAVFGGGFLAIGWSLLPGQQQLYQAGPLATVHAMYKNDCQACHTESFQTALRILDPQARSVPDAACEKCHAGHIHHATQAWPTNCVHCHREHRGDHDLTRIPEEMCLSCHRDLKHGVKPGVRPQFLDVFDWQHHPEFRGLHRARKDGDVGPLDPGTIRFNHHTHLQPDGVLTLDRTQAGLQREMSDRSAVRKTLKCADCHEPDSAGQFMKPINFEKHCGECHPLSVQVVQTSDRPATLAALRAYAAKPAPHAAPEIVRGVLRDRLTQFIQANPDLLPQVGKPARPIPGASQRSVTEKEFAWVNDQLQKIEAGIFQQAGWCRYCHTPVAEPQTGSLPEFLPSRINSRLFPQQNDGKTRWHDREQWFPHSRFNHETHRMVECTNCHKGIRDSKATGELHMPTIAACRQCHTGNVGASARSDCAECHNYHPRVKLSGE